MILQYSHGRTMANIRFGPCRNCADCMERGGARRTPAGMAAEGKTGASRADLRYKEDEYT